MHGSCVLFLCFFVVGEMLVCFWHVDSSLTSSLYRSTDASVSMMFDLIRITTRLPLKGPQEHDCVRGKHTSRTIFRGGKFLQVFIIFSSRRPINRKMEFGRQGNEYLVHAMLCSKHLLFQEPKGKPKSVFE